ncbi:hypothetical protein IC235_17460 [Hymenobacter sp. BT664]|uniref:Uncharacterized protein n=1 Tax=Hymenobacter montanus TaxID=2771359 RepID=A0A927BFW3_9BACT|nr:hypothetical protein [Hymenobacter montanus]MBD2769681.1 hypothetical protein [Hymenobacter montanus]
MFFIRKPRLLQTGLFRAHAQFMSTSATLRRQANLDTRNRKIRDAFYQRYTRVPRERKPDRGQVVAQLPEKFFLSIATLEKLLYAAVK